MKALFFDALAPHPKVAGALMGQAAQTLRPFNQYLRQAIHTAKQRQTRYSLNWEPVREPKTVNLKAKDTAILLPISQAMIRLKGWDERLTPDIEQMAFIVNRALPVSITSFKKTPQGLTIESTPQVEDGDELIWCEQKHRVEVLDHGAPPKEIRTLEGNALPLRRAPMDWGDGYWQLIIEGKIEDGPLWIDGKRVEARILDEMPERLVDSDGRNYPLNRGQLIVEQLPAEGPLRGDNGIRYSWRSCKKREENKRWIRLLPPKKSDANALMDPRAAFCEGDIREVWTQARRSPQSTIRVFKVDADRYQLLVDRLPPSDNELFLPVDLRNLHLQRRALNQLTYAPLPHHQGLLRLCEDPRRVRWPRVQARTLHEEEWQALTDLNRSGTPEQRRFVEKALGTPDFAFLEGPPGSGKTTSIVEIIHQLALRGERVLLCASTHVAIDNVLERLLESKAPIDALRVGRLDRVDETVSACQLDQRIETLVETWQAEPQFKGLGSEALRKMAERTLIMSANLTCGTTMGIVNHPLFRDEDRDQPIWQRPITSMPHWDVLIIDEASKTLIQEFMVPALMAKRWIIVGDVQQLPPFTDRGNIVANLRDLIDEKDKPLFPRDHQRACLLRYRMQRWQLRQPEMRWLIVETPGVLNFLNDELKKAPMDGLAITQILRHPRRPSQAISYVTIDQIKKGGPEALALYAADWLLVEKDLLPKIADDLPSNLLQARFLNGDTNDNSPIKSFQFRQQWWLDRVGALEEPYREPRSRRKEVSTFTECQENEANWLSRTDLAQALAWRLTRLHELRASANHREKTRLKQHLDMLAPKAVDISGALGELQDIGLPSILEVLQRGIGDGHSRRQSALSAGFRTAEDHDFNDRFETLVYQHRMHPDISAFPRQIIYNDKALKDANTIAQRDEIVGWDFGPFPSRKAWLQVLGREKGGVNLDEVAAIIGIIKAFLAWAKDRDVPPGRASGRWEVACLSFYAKQERALSDALRALTKDDRRTRFTPAGVPVEIVCGTVDRFQGREADLVLLSMRNTKRIGFLDSPNRLNVAVTRARQQLIVVGNATYFSRCGVTELKALADQSPEIPRNRNTRSQKR